LNPESTKVFVDIIRILGEYPNAKFTVEGHTDSVGSEQLNQSLSEKRANSVRDFLIAEGIAADRLTAVGYGESKPIATNNTRAGRAQNRRTEINLVK
ncbi:MAG TPA: OmpA family protein, partial [Eudoraea sp.]|nr:OmpA family protein [Eudoraea sp.]